jgi:hypothetical protein
MEVRSKKAEGGSEGTDSFSEDWRRRKLLAPVLDLEYLSLLDLSGV